VKSVFLAVVLAILLPMATAAESRTSKLTATEVFDPFNLLGNGQVGTSTNPGTVNCPGAVPTGNPMQPCPAGSPIHLRDVWGTSKMISQNPLLQGVLHWTINANFDETAAGYAWGTFRLELDNGGIWEGSYSNFREKVEGINAWVGRACFLGRGTSGRVDRMYLRFKEVAFTFMPMPVAWVGAVDADIVAPHHR
jgi:hypothetical protein